MEAGNSETATFGAGCFWGVEEAFRTTPGVVGTEVGYAGGVTEHPSYQDVCSDRTGHAEVVRVVFDPEQVSYDTLLARFFECHDPTQVNRQGPDVGGQYRSVVFTHSLEQERQALKMIEDHNNSGRYSRPIATQVVPAGPFWRAEEYHQKYLLRRGLDRCRL